MKCLGRLGERLRSLLLSEHQKAEIARLREAVRKADASLAEAERQRARLQGEGR